ncbi:MAG: hypothetical protein LBP25_03830 [Tannerellaceae bacterium]|jgi:hypothetical protein|nr:hypothetical protein [Tannerellaceae bacterium]
MIMSIPAPAAYTVAVRVRVVIARTATPPTLASVPVMGFVRFRPVCYSTPPALASVPVMLSESASPANASFIMSEYFTCKVNYPIIKFRDEIKDGIKQHCYCHEIENNFPTNRVAESGGVKEIKKSKENK